jgi:hypothetical protein
VDYRSARFRLIIWLLYFLGVSLHILLRARASIAAASNSVSTFRSWWQYNWHDLGWRLFLDGVGLMGWELSFYVPGLKDFIVHVLPPVCYGAGPIMGIVVDRFVDSGGFILGFNRTDMPRIAPSSTEPTGRT